MTERERKLAEKIGALDGLYSDRIVELIRAKYSINDELAIQRQKEEKPEVFKKYYADVEDCKVKAYKEIYGEDIEPDEVGATTKEYQEQLERLGL